MKRYIAIVLAVLLLLGGCAAEAPQETMSEEFAQQVLQERRDAAEAHMRYMMSVLWQPGEQIVYSTLVSSLGPGMDGEDRTVVLAPDRVYSGMPYTHGNGGAESFLSYGQPNEKGVIQMDGLTSELLSGGGGSKPNNMARLSNDCADAVSWAWGKVGSSFTFTMTMNMTEGRGCIPVGSYTTEPETYKKTKDIVNENGLAVMCEAYAQLQKADALVCYNGSGHAMLVSQVNVVQKDGAIDPEESYVLVHEQFTSNYNREVTRVDEATGLTVYCLGGVDRKYTFQQLFQKSYLPVTIRELIDPAVTPDPELVDSLDSPGLDTIADGSISCIYQICMVTLTIKDADGNVIQQATCFPTEGERHMFRMARFADPMEQQVMRGKIDTDALPAGSYCCVVECLVSTGDTLTGRIFNFDKQ